jgi:hypothetical protein
MVEYHDILWDIDYAKTFEEAYENLANLYAERPPLNDFLVWRELRVMDEIHWYGWFIDYWMEEGLMRDMFTHKITTPEHWNLLMVPTARSKEDMTYELIVGDAVVAPSFDPHCLGDLVNCHPVEIISAERLVETETGKDEGRKIAQVLEGNEGIDLIAEETWGCIWEELIVNKKGLKTFLDREGVEERDYSFSPEMLEAMLIELDRLLEKYGSSDWVANQNAITLVDILSDHRALVEAEWIEELNNSTRKLEDYDFLGPSTRAQLSGDKRFLSKNFKPEFDFLGLERRLKEQRHIELKRRLIHAHEERMLMRKAAQEQGLVDHV